MGNITLATSKPKADLAVKPELENATTAKATLLSSDQAKPALSDQRLQIDP